MKPILQRSFCLLLCAGMLPAQAHDWPSPSSPGQRTPTPARWPGLLWPGPQAGMPAPPSARDCQRQPRRFDLPEAAGARPAPQGGAHDDDAALRSDARPVHKHRAAEAATLSAAPAPTAGPAIAPAHEALPTVPERQPPRDERITAGVVDDNADFAAYRQFRQRHAQQQHRPWLLHERVRLEVRDGAGRAVPDARVEVFAEGPERVLQPLAARTDSAGRAWLLPQADVSGSELTLRVSRGSAVQQVRWQRGQRDALQVRLDGAPAPGRPRLDLVLAIDATGSMGDEIDKLKRSMREVADRIAALPGAPDLCFGLVAYRDRGDAFFVKGADLTHDLSAFQTELGALRAGGGGDEPEALAEALHTAVHRLSWRGEGTARMVLLLADAPPQRRPEGPHIDDEARAAQARGIKIVSIGASGLNREGELALRLAAQATGGRFVFLTYANRHDPSSGPGRDTVHEVRDYSVETLDKLVLRLVSEELAAWPTP